MDNQLLITEKSWCPWPLWLLVEKRINGIKIFLFFCQKPPKQAPGRKALTVRGSRSHEALSLQTAREVHLESALCRCNPGPKTRPKKQVYINIPNELHPGKTSLLPLVALETDLLFFPSCSEDGGRVER